MLSIALIHSGKSFMPEIAAYQNYFEEAGIRARILIEPSQEAMETYDILWFFMGVQKSLNEINKKKMVIHEYCSASTPPFARIKDRIKKMVNLKPVLRISLAMQHKGTVFPIDDTPVVIRKQGVHDCFFERISCAKEYDFIYTGSALKIRQTDKWLHTFTAMFPGSSIILTGNHERSITDQFKSNSRIHFNEAVEITELPLLLAKSKFAINYVPDVYPFNIQPSTKMLEYCAAGCNIISNRYEWVNDFSRQKLAGFYFLDRDFGNLSSSSLEDFHFNSPDLTEYRWQNVFREMELQRIISGEAIS